MEAVIKNYTSIRNGATSDRGVVSDSLCYNGSLLEKKGIRFFYRKRVRLKEVISGRPEGYSLGIEDYILEELKSKNCEYILIETQFKKYKISLSKFLDNCFHYGFGNQVSCCVINNFEVTDIKEEVTEEEATHEEPKKTPEKKEKKVKFGGQGSLFIWFFIIVNSLL